MRILKSPFKRIERLRFSPDGGKLIGAGVARSQWSPPNVTRGMAWWDLTGDAEPGCFLPESRVVTFTFLPDGERCAVLASNSGVVVWHLRDSRRDKKFNYSSLSPVAFSHDGTVVAGIQHAQGEGRFGLELRYSRLYRVNTTEVWSRSLDSFDARAHCLELEFFSDGRTLAFLYAQSDPRGQRWIRDFKLDILSTETGDSLRTVPFPLKPVNGIAVAPDQTRFAVLAGHDIVCSDFDHAENPTTITNDNASHFTDVAFHPSSRLLAAASNDQTIKLFETDTWSPVGTFAWNSGKLRSVAFSPDGTVAAAGTSTGQVVLWDVDV